MESFSPPVSLLAYYIAALLSLLLSTFFFIPFSFFPGQTPEELSLARLVPVITVLGEALS